MLPLALGLSAVAILVAVAFTAVRVTGGSPSPLNHVAYAPILLAAYLWGWRAAVVTAAAVTFVMGPLASVLAFVGGLENFEAWATRGMFFVGVGVVVGGLLDRSRRAEERLRGVVVKVSEREREGTTALARGLAAKDGHTGDHVTRVASLSEDLAGAAGLSEADAHDIGWSAMLHDVGKLHVPDSILLKPGPLSAAEWDIVRQHPLWGAEILAHGDGFEMARRIARWHHENFDGSGYPDNLRRDGIPIEARIVRITDAFDAITHQRPYHEARSFEFAVEELERGGGKHFDPELVRLFLDLAVAGRIETINEELRTGATART